MATEQPLITCIARMTPQEGREAEVLAARSRMLREFGDIDGFVSATLYRVSDTDRPGEIGEWRDIIVFASEDAVKATADCPGYQEWSALTDFRGYEYIDLID